MGGHLLDGEVTPNVRRGPRAGETLHAGAEVFREVTPHSC